MIRRFLFIAFCVVALAGRHAQAQGDVHPLPRQEMRGLWVVRDSITSPEAIRRIVQQATRHHVNALFVQVRGRGDAFYLSRLEPRAEELAGKPKDFDPLAEMLRQGHAAGLQIHAWMNTCYVWGAGRRPYSHSHVVNRHPDWLARDAKRRFQIKAGNGCEGAFMSPANLAARRHIHDVFLDVASRYDIDGIHFDYVRYPNASYDYSDAALERFKIERQSSLTAAQVSDFARRGNRDRLVYPHAFPAQWQEFRRRQVTELVAGICQDIKAIKPWVIVSAAVFADSKDAMTTRGQDWKTWLQRGYLDAVVPMAYGASTPQVAKQIADAVACARAAGRYVYAGLGSWHIPAASTVVKIDVARSLGTQGWVLFSYGGVTRDGRTTAYLDSVDAQCASDIATVPVMPWLVPHPADANAEDTADPAGAGG